MRILFLNQVAAPVQGEMNQYVFDVANRLRDAGHVVAIVHGRRTPVEFAGTRYVFDHLEDSVAANEDVKVRLEAIVDDFEPDVIQLHGAPNIRLDAWLSARCPTVRFIHNHRLYCSGQHMTWRMPRRICERPHGKGCLVSHALHRCGSYNPALNFLRYQRVSNSLKALRSLQGIQVASRVVRDNLIRNGVEPDRIEYIPLYAAPPPEMRKLPALKKMIFHPGGLVRNKGVWLLAKNLHLFPEDVELVFAGGGGDLQKPLESYVKDKGLGERIRIMGDVSPAQWSQLCHQATVVVMPSMWNEPLGLAGLQAMAHGKPIVAFQSHGISEWLNNGINGVAVPFGNRKMFVDRVKEVLSQPDTLAQMGREGRRIWEEKFHPAHHLERIQAHYTRILNGG